MPLLSSTDMSVKIASLGLKRKYKPYHENTEKARPVILQQTRQPPVITGGGIMHGCEMDIHDDQTVRVWTSQKKKAADLARTNGFNVRLLDGEAELYIPIARADEFLHSLGAKVKVNRPPPVMTPEWRAKSLAALAAYRAGRKAAAQQAANSPATAASLCIQGTSSDPGA